MIEVLLEPFMYNYMVKAILLSACVGGVCAFLSAYLMLKGWSLIGDALSHAVVPGVAIAYALGLPYALGAFFSGILAALAILWIKSITKLREDAIIGFIFTTFFALGLFIISLNPTSVNVQEIIFGNILGIADDDVWQVGIIMLISFIFLLVYNKDLLLVFFDEVHAKSIGLSPRLCGCSTANCRGNFGYRYGNYAWSNCISAHGQIPLFVMDCRLFGHSYQRFGYLYQLLFRWSDRRGNCYLANFTISFSFFVFA